MARKRPDLTLRNLLDNPMKNPHTVEKVAAFHRGRKQSKEHIEKRVQELRLLHREHPELWANAYKLMKGHPFWGPKKQSDETRRLMSQSRKEYLSHHPEVVEYLEPQESVNTMDSAQNNQPKPKRSVLLV
jgi:hypothetical protein